VYIRQPATHTHTHTRRTHRDTQTQSQRHVLSAIWTKRLMQHGDDDDALLQRAGTQGGKTDIMCLMASCPCEFSPASTHDIHVTCQPVLKTCVRALVSRDRQYCLSVLTAVHYKLVSASERDSARRYLCNKSTVVLFQTVLTPKSGFDRKRKRREHFQLCRPTPQNSHSPKPFLESTLLLSSRGSQP
jgi:hypothetical protein